MHVILFHQFGLVQPAQPVLGEGEGNWQPPQGQCSFRQRIFATCWNMVPQHAFQMGLLRKQPAKPVLA